MTELQIDQRTVGAMLGRGAHLRVLDGAGMGSVMAEGRLVAYSDLPSITLEETDGRRSHWPVVLPMQEIPAPVAELPPLAGESPVVRVTAHNVMALVASATNLRVYDTLASDVLAEGELVGFCSSPSIALQHPDGSTTSWSTELPMERIDQPGPTTAQQQAEFGLKRILARAEAGYREIVTQYERPLPGCPVPTGVREHFNYDVPALITAVAKLTGELEQTRRELGRQRQIAEHERRQSADLRQAADRRGGGEGR